MTLVDMDPRVRAKYLTDSQERISRIAGYFVAEVRHNHNVSDAVQAPPSASVKSIASVHDRHQGILSHGSGIPYVE